jgi:hypothetical protein
MGSKSARSWAKLLVHVPEAEELREAVWLLEAGQRGIGIA